MPIKLTHVSHVYMPGTPFESTALEDINLTLDEGEFIGLIGHTGSGKSTLVQHINGLLMPTGGSINVFGVELTEKGADLKRVRRDVGLVFQYPEHQLFEETVEADVAFGPKNMGLSGDELNECVRHAIARVGLDFDAVHDRSPFELSGGQRRRVAIAGVIAMEPEVVIFDEPTAGLDPAGCASILGNIRDYQKATHATILMVTHSMDEVAQLADRMLVLNEGTIEMSGTPREVFSHAARLAEIGLSVPQVTALFLRLRELGVDVDPTTFTVEQAVPQLRALLEGRAHA